MTGTASSARSFLHAQRERDDARDEASAEQAGHVAFSVLGIAEGRVVVAQRVEN